MPRNIEAKFRDVDLTAIRDRARTMGARDEGILSQLDTFFACNHGRLKLREFGDGTGELIAYARPNEAATRASDYQISRTGDPASLREALGRACGEAGRVAKQRNLWMWRNVRIHLDRVEELGEFCELESVVGEVDESTARANLEAVIDALGLRNAAQLASAYVDLLNGATSVSPRTR